MATRNLVPRANNEGKIGTSSKKWNEANFTTGNFTTLTIAGNLTVNGTTTTINSTTLTVDDPIITLGGDTAPSSDDNKDRGIEFRYHNGSSAKVGFFGFDDSTSKFTFIADATNSSEVFSGSAGNVAFGSGEFTSLTSAGLTSTNAITLNAQNELRFADADSTHYIGFKSPATVGSNLIWTLPATDGSDGQVLKTNGSGTLAWVDQSAGGGGDITGVTAGTGLSGGGNTGAVTLNLDINGLTADSNAGNLSDTMAIADASDSNNPKKITLTQLQTLIGGGTGDITDVAAGTGLTGGGSSGSVSLNLGIQEFTEVQIAAGDKLLVLDSDNSTHQLEKIEDIATLFAGTGLSSSSTSISVDLNELSAAAVDVGNDSIAIIDANDSNGSKKESIVDLITAVAGDGLAASSGVLAVGVDDSSIEIDSDALRVKASGVTNAMLAGSIADTKLNQITTADKVAGSSVQLAGTSALENSTGLRIKDSTAGVGLAISSQVLSVDLNELSAAAVDVAADSIVIIDANDSNGSKKESIADLVAGIAGTGLTASSGQLTVTGGTTNEATNVTVTANNSTDETVYPTFVDGATGAQGIETDTGLTYNPSTGILTTEVLSAKSDLRLEHSGTTKTITVTVAAKSAAHRYNGSGSSSGYKLDGVESPFLLLSPGRTYKFDQGDGTNNGHPLRFYLDANKVSAYTTGVTTNGTPGTSGAYTQIVVSDTTPQVLHYQCSAHSLMGNALQSNSVASKEYTTGLKYTDSPQFTGLELGHVSDTTITRASAGDINIEGNIIYRAGGTDVPVTDGGTGASSAADARTNLGLVIGTNVQAYDADLAAIAGLTSAADKGIQFTGSGTAAVYDLTAAGKALLDDADAAAQRTTLGLGTAATLAVGISNTNVLQANSNVADNDFLKVDGTSIEGRTAAEVLSDIGAQASDTGLTSIAGLTTAANKMIYTTDSDTYAVTSLTAAGRAILDDADAAAQRVTLGVGTTDSPTFAGGTLGNVQVGLTGDNEIDTSSGNLTIDSAGGTVTIDDNLTVSGNASIVGNLTVSGTTTTLNSEIALADRFVLLNSNYTTNAALDGGIVVNVDPSGTVYDGSSININFNSTTTVQIEGDASTELAENKIFMIRNAEDAANNGLYQVHSVNHNSGTTTVTIKNGAQASAAVSGIVNTSFTTNADDDSVVIARTKIAVLKSDTANNVFEVGFGDDGSSLSYTDLATSGGGITGLSTNASDTLTIGTNYNLIPNSAGTSDLGTASAEFGNIFIADDKKLQFGSDQDVTIEYDEDGDDVLQIAGGNIRIGHGAASQLQFRDSAIYINSDADGYLNARADTGITLNVNGTDELALTGSTATFGTNIVVPDAATIGSASDTDAIAISSAGVITLSATTEASAIGTAALVVAGGASIAKDLYVGDDLELDSDSAKIGFGADSDVSLTHVADTGLLLNSSRKLQFGDSGTFIHQSSDGVLTIESDTTVDINGAVVMNGALTGLTSINVGGTITGDTSLTLDSTTITTAEIGVLDGVTAGTAAASKALVLDANKDIGTIRNLTIDGTFSDGNYTFDTSGNVSGLGTVGCGAITSTGTSTFAGGVTPASADGAALGSASAEWSDLYLALGGQILFGNNQKVTVTHEENKGLILKNGNVGDDNPFVLTLQTGETDIAANDVIGAINFQAPDEGTGTDAVLVCAGIEAVSEGDFSASSNATKLSFKTGASEAASEKMSLSSAGNLTVSGSSTFNAGISVKNGATSAGFIELFEDSDDGTNKVKIQAPTLASDYTLTLPVDDGSANQVLKTDGNGVLSWVDQSGGGSTAADDIGQGDSAVDIITTSGDITLNAAHSSGNILFKSNNTEFLKIDMGGNVKFGAGAGSTGVTITSQGQITADGRLIIDNTINATSTTDGSLQTDGGLSVVKDTVLGDDLFLKSDASVIHFGADSEITLTHVADTGLTLKHTATADDKPVKLTLATGETDIAADDIIGAINFQAPDEGTGTDAILVCAGIEAVSEGDFAANNNATKLSFKTAASEAASEKMSLSSGGNLTISGDLAVNGDTSTFASANSTDPLVIIKNTTNDANGARLRLVKDKGAAGADNDVAGLIEFYADDDNQDNIMFAEIKAQVADASNGAEGGKLSLSVATHDGESQPGLVLVDGDAEDEVDITLGNGSNSLTTVAGKISLGGVAYTFPASDGSNGQFLKTNGSGTLSFGAASGGGGSRTEPITMTAATHTIGSTDNSDTAIQSTELERVYLMNVTSGAATTTLPSAIGLDGFKLQIKRIGNQNITITAPAPSSTQQTIDGQNTYVLSTQYESLTIISDNANWFII